MVPGLSIFLTMGLFPIGYTFYTSFYNWGGVGLKRTWIGLANYIELFTDYRFLIALKNNAIWMIFAVTIPIIIGFIVAYLINQNIRAENFFKAVIYYPGVISFIIAGTIFSLIFNLNHGLLNETLRFLGLDFLALNWLGSYGTSMIAMMIVMTWQGVGFYMLVFLAALRNIPKSLIEASEIDGASVLRRIFNIIIPLMKPVTTVLIATALINSVRMFDIIYAMTGGGPSYKTTVLGLEMWNVAFAGGRWGLGSAYGIVIFILTSTFGFVYINQMMKGEGDVY